MFGENREKRCVRCGELLTGRQLHWCSRSCVYWWRANHYYGAARLAALDNAEVYALEHCKKNACDVQWDWFTGTYTEVPQPHGHPIGRACARCDLIGGFRPEVDHIEQALGRHSKTDCIHHQTNLRVLCVPCHRAVTAEQRRLRKAA